MKVSSVEKADTARNCRRVRFGLLGVDCAKLNPPPKAAV